MIRKRVIYSTILFIFALTLVLGSISTSNSLFIINDTDGENLLLNSNFELSKQIQLQEFNEKSALFSQESLESLTNDQWSYLTQTYYKNDIDWVEIDNSSKEILPFAHRYRTNFDVDDWQSLLTPNPDVPYSYQNSTIPHDSVWKSNESTPFAIPSSFVPNFSVNVTLFVNDTNTAGDVDLFVYDEFNALVGSSVQVNATETVIFTPSDDRNYTYFISFPVSSVITTTNITLEIDQVVDQTKYGMTPGYVPIKPLSYSNTNIPSSSSLWTDLVPDFPYVLRFIPNYPVTITLDAFNTTTDGEVHLFVYDSISILPIVQSTNDFPLSDSVTFTPTTEEPHKVEVRNVNSTHSSRITLKISQKINPNFLNVYIGDDGKKYD
jgi:hypothetical protein